MSEQSKPVVQVSKLLRAGDAKVNTLDQWQAPDLTELKLKEAEQRLKYFLEQAKVEVAEELKILREGDRLAAFEEGRQQGLTQGYDEGYALGLKEAQAVVDQAFDEKMTIWKAEQAKIRDDWQSLFNQIAQVFDVLDVDFFDQVIWLSGEIAKRIVRAELHLNPEHIQRIVGDALAELPKLVYPVSIYVHPQDIELVEKLSFDHDKKVHILPDEKLLRGECRVISGHSELFHNWKLLSEQVMDQMLAQFVQISQPSREIESSASTQDDDKVTDHEK